VKAVMVVAVVMVGSAECGETAVEIEKIGTISE
jgi:hypothetical protein